MTDKPQCPSCEFNIPAQFYIGREFRVELECRKKMLTYPDATHCPYYQRAAGAD